MYVPEEMIVSFVNDMGKGELGKLHELKEKL